MDKLKKIVVILVILLLIGYGCNDTGISRVSFYEFGQEIESNVLDPEEYYEEFLAVVETIDMHYALMERKNLTKKDIKATFDERAELVSNRFEYLELMTELFAKLNNGHARVFEYRSCALVEASILDSRVFISNIGSDKELRALNLEVGDEIIEIDGMPISQWLNEKSKYFGGANSKQKRDLELHVFMKYPFEGETRQYTIRDKKGDVYEIEIEFPYNFSHFLGEFTTPLESRVIQTTKGIGYIAINEMTDTAYDLFVKELQHLSYIDTLILDLRENGGGSSLIGDKLFTHLIDENTHNWSTLANNSEPNEPNSLRFTGELIVLTSHKTFSAAESFAFDLMSLSNTFFIGDITGGCSGGGPRSFVTDSGLGFSFPTRGVDYSVTGDEMEGYGLVPDLILKQTHEDLKEGRDTILDYAVRYASDNN